MQRREAQEVRDGVKQVEIDPCTIGLPALRDPRLPSTFSRCSVSSHRLRASDFPSRFHRGRVIDEFALLENQ